MVKQKPVDPWVEQYSRSHRHPVNRACHMFGIPMIVVSLALFVAAYFAPALWLPATALFLLGWTLQFVGHWIEGKAPEFFHDRRYLFVGLRWWFAKIRGRA